MRYIVRRPGLLGLNAIFMLIFLFASLTYFSTLAPMVLARSGGDELVLAGVQAALGVGGIAGGIVLAIWGGPRRKLHGILAFCAASFLCGDLVFALGRTPAAWFAAAFIASFFLPFVTSAHRALWQAKVPHDIQGRVLGTAFAMQQLTRPLGYLLGGPLADHVFEPVMMPGGALSGVFGGLTGTGPGAGIGLMFLGTALLGTASCLSGYLWRAVRRVEDDLPDADAVPRARPGLAAAD